MRTSASVRTTSTHSSVDAAAARPDGLAYNRWMFGGIVAVGTGAALGAWLRWGLAAWLNPRLPHFPLGTLAANLIGGYLVGFAVAYFARGTISRRRSACSRSPDSGGLTTFSTFSAEVIQLLVRGEYATGGGLAWRILRARCC